MAHCIRYIKYKQFRDHDFEITSKINVIRNNYYDTVPTHDAFGRPIPGAEERKKHYAELRKRKDQPTIRGAVESLRRCHNNLSDVLRSNVWSWFVTLTFGDAEKRLDDQYCRDRFADWRTSVRRNLPNMFYVAVPEYHKKGGLHYHLVLGGVSAKELGLVDSGRVLHHGKSWRRKDFFAKGFEVDIETGEGFTIYNIPSWNSFSTATEVRSSDAVTRYVSKYMSKANIDPRFYNKKRFYCSANVHRPKVLEQNIPTTFGNEVFNLCEMSGGCLDYRNNYTRYEKYSVPPSKEDIIKMRLDGVLPMPKHSLPFDVD